MVPETEHLNHPQDSFLGAVVDGRFRLIGVLLPMERGAVYRAVEDPVGQEVALRVFVHGQKDEAREEERFRREAEPLLALRNPGVVSVLAVGTGSGFHWATYELIRAEALAQGLQRGPLAWTQVLGLTQHLLAGLDAAHRLGFLHGELTPANILIIQEQAGLRARLAGLGSNRLFGIELRGGTTPGGESALLRPGLVEYVSPEQIEGKHLGPWSDVYSLGAVLFHMISGRPAVVGDPAAMLNAHLQGQLQRLEPAYACPQPVLDLVQRALARPPAHRFPDARSMYEEISRILAVPQHPMVPGVQGAPRATGPAPGRPTGSHGVAPPATRILEKFGDAAQLQGSRPAEPSARPAPGARPPAGDSLPDAGSTMDIDLEEVAEVEIVQEIGELPTSAAAPALSAVAARPLGGRRAEGAGGTMDIEVDEIQELDLSDSELPRHAEPRGNGWAPTPVTPGVASGFTPPAAAPRPAPGFPSREVEGYRAAPAPEPHRAAEPAPGPLKAPPPDPKGADREKATLLVDVDELEMARLQQEYASGRPAGEQEAGKTGKLPLPLPALIGVGALAAALLVIVVVAGVHWVRSRRPPEPPAAVTEAAKAMELFAALNRQEGVLPVEDGAPAESLGDTPLTLEEWRAQAEERVSEVTRRDTEIGRQITTMVQQARQLIELVPPRDRATAHRLARELVGLSSTRRGLSQEAAQLRAALRRADEEKLKGIAANAWGLRSNLMEVLGYSQSAFDELRELVPAARPAAGPASEPTAVAAATPPPPPERSPTVVAASEPPRLVSGGSRPPTLREDRPASSSRPSTIEIPAPTTSRRAEPVDPELSSLIASVRPTAELPRPIPVTPISPTGSPAATATTVASAPTMAPGTISESPGGGSEAVFVPVTSTPNRVPPAKGTAKKTAGSSESDEDLLLRILGSPREGPIVVTGESCPCTPKNVETAARAGGRGLTECELRACEKVPPGTHHFSEINLNLASYFFQQRNLRREFEALYRATSYGSYKHDPQVLGAYIKVAVKLKRFQIALQAKDRFLFVQDKLPPDQRRPKVAEIYKVLAQAFEHQFYRQKERKPKSTDFTYLNRSIDFWERYADYSGERSRAESTIAELKRLRAELEQEQ
ncbi:MAG: serine/threonine-protein kinase [Myxococcota bacterium]|jgi:serine/threonine-protein kinase|nr:serine/threonine-protein kinase [Myxococcota bacterium]